MKTIQTVAQNKEELNYLVRALYAIGCTCRGYTADEYINGEYMNVRLYPSGEIVGNRTVDGRNFISVADFLIEAARLKFPSKLSWKVGCRDIEVSSDGKSLRVVHDDITITKATLESMLKALK